MLTWPNLLTTIRLTGVPILIALIMTQQPVWVLGLGVFLVLTDWLDGVLARWLGQQTSLGARLDTIADVSLGLTLLIAVTRLNWNFATQNCTAILIVAGTYAASGIYALWKFGQWPSYHNYLAKAGMISGSIAGVAVLSQSVGVCPDWLAVALFYLAAAVITFANLEAIMITSALRVYRNNVGSIWHYRQREPPEISAGD